MQTNLGQHLLEAAERASQRPAIIGTGGGQSFGELSEAADAVAGALREEARGQPRIGILLPNTAAFPIALHGALRAGASALLLNPVNSPRELSEQLEDAGVTTVLTSERLLGQLPPGVVGLLVDELPGQLVGVAGSIRRAIALAAGAGTAGERAGADAEAVVIFTSAMDGRARGAGLTHANLVSNLHATIEALGLKSSDRVYAALPFAHAFGLTVCLNAPLAAGAQVIAAARFNPLSAVEELAALGATVMAGVPAMYIGMLNAAEKRGVAPHSLRVALCGGAALPLEVARRWEEVFGIPLRQGYGLTEASPVCLFNRPGEPNRPGTLGTPLPGIEITIRDPDGEVLPDGEVGQLCVRGPNVFPGYIGNGARPFHGEWLLTGDLASQSGGVVRFRGVLKKMFTRNGFNVYPEEVRRVLMEDPRIVDAVVCGLPDAVRENEVVLEIRLATGARMSEEDVRELCLAKLALYKQPSKVRMVRE